MKIKYHQHGIQPEYDPKTHMLTDNWNPDLDYGNEYVEVYFRIDTENFDNMQGGFETAEACKRWHEEISSLISSFGILEDSGFKVEHSPEKQAYLYAHPQNISGVILKNGVKKIAEAIDKMKMSSIRWVDLYDTVYDMTNGEYTKYLITKRDEIRYKLFYASHTRTRNEFHCLRDITKRVSQTVEKKRLGEPKVSDTLRGGQTGAFVTAMATEMVGEGYLVYQIINNETYVRSVNKTEFKKLGLQELEAV